jgi:TRAP-type C4-dicarboxylate transport system permease small subunit
MVIPLPPVARAILYWVYVGIALVLGAVAIWVATTTADKPVWLEPANEALLLLAAAFGITAATNTQVVVDPTAFPPAARKVTYWIFTVATLLVSIFSLVFRGIDGIAEPFWMDAANQILIFLGVAFGFTAASHVAPDPPPADLAQPELG